MPLKVRKRGREIGIKGRQRDVVDKERERGREELREREEREREVKCL